MNTCYIIAAGKSRRIDFTPDETDLIICADGGYEKAVEHGYTPDIIVGDFDSSKSVPKGDNVYIYPSEKDDTDTTIAIDYGFEKGYKTFKLYCALGGRLDHTYANISLLSYVANKGGSAALVGDDCCVTLIKNDKIVFDESESGTVSVFSFTDKSEGVYEKNLKYGLEDFTMYSSCVRGISNEFTGKKSEISVKNGELVIMWGCTD